MKHQLLGTSKIDVSRLAYGCLRISDSPAGDRTNPEAIRNGILLVETAVEAGFTFFDHADNYANGACESIFGEALQLHPTWRENLVIATKCGCRRDGDPHPTSLYRYDSSYDHIVRSVESSLTRLHAGTIDLLMLHRPDWLSDPEEIARAFIKLRSDGKVREFGVSNFRPSLISAIQSALPFALQTNQVEIHLRELSCFTDGTLDQCLERQITPLAWCPLDRGKLAAGYVPDTKADDYSRHLALLQALDSAAAEFETDRTIIALAWLLRHPSKIIPIVGSANPANIRNASRATEVELDRETWYRILLAAQGRKLP